MDPEQQAPPSNKNKQPTYLKSWDDFIDRAMQILVDQPVLARCVIKYVPRRNEFVLKVTDGKAIAMKRAEASSEFEQIEKFSHLVSRALTNEADE